MQSVHNLERESLTSLYRRARVIKRLSISRLAPPPFQIPVKDPFHLYAEPSSALSSVPAGL